MGNESSAKVTDIWSSGLDEDEEIKHVMLKITISSLNTLKQVLEAHEVGDTVFTASGKKKKKVLNTKLK